MTSLHLRGSMTSADSGAQNARPHRRGVAKVPQEDAFATIRGWCARRRRRKSLGRLAELDDHMLKDIGLSREEALRESAKWFWQR